MWTPAEVVLAEGSAEWFCSRSWAAEGCTRVLLSLHKFVTTAHSPAGVGERHLHWAVHVIFPNKETQFLPPGMSMLMREMKIPDKCEMARPTTCSGEGERVP